MNVQEDGVEERTWWPVVTIPLEEWRVDERLVLPITREPAAGKKYDELKAASKAAWEKTKDGFASAWGEVEMTFENVKTEYF